MLQVGNFFHELVLLNFSSTADVQHVTCSKQLNSTLYTALAFGKFVVEKTLPKAAPKPCHVRRTDAVTNDNRNSPELSVQHITRTTPPTKVNKAGPALLVRIKCKLLWLSSLHHQRPIARAESQIVETTSFHSPAAIEISTSTFAAHLLSRSITTNMTLNASRWLSSAFVLANIDN